LHRGGFRHGVTGRYRLVSDVRLAATVILARLPLEVYLTRRSARSAFAPDAFVFPGGTVEAQDATREAEARTIGLEPDRLGQEFRASISPALASSEPAVGQDAARSLLVAALRELFEEAGVLLARDRSHRPIAADSEQLGAQRVAVRKGELTFADFLTGHDWYADARALTLFSHWITPPSEPRRYNTHFFFAAAPPNQAARADAHETHDGIWIAPSQALEQYRAGALHLVYPTIKHLERLSAFASVDDALRYALTKPVLTIMPSAGADDFAIPAALENAW
jgi:8-oxo-dGTP pyrophosphatase MutT (NUDIX family)